jgi:hypothetical protein
MRQTQPDGINGATIRENTDCDTEMEADMEARRAQFGKPCAFNTVFPLLRHAAEDNEGA